MLRLPKFTYLQPKTVAEAVRMIADTGPEAMFVAGGTDLYPNMKRRQQTPQVVIGLSQLDRLRTIKGKAAEGMVLGAGATLTEVAEHRRLRRAYPVLAHAVELISTPLLRNMGSIGGNLLLDTRCNYYNQNYEWRKAIHFCMKKDGEICWVAPSSPRCWAVQSSDCAPVMVAIGAKVKLVSREGERLLPAAELYNDDGIEHLRKRPDELLTEIHLPPTNGWRATYWKLRRRGSFDFPVLGVASCLRLAGDGTVEDAKIILGGVGPSPLEAVAAQKAIIGRKLTEQTISEAAAAAYPAAKPLDNTDFAMTWRKDMARHYVAGTLRELGGLSPSFPSSDNDSGSSGLRVLSGGSGA
ncbi:MAG: FAD binding domain-containing protein [Acidobacteria bacterium]|nr:FAD binding domain-containing protein [Acidobacteriota bacterium]